MRVFRAIAALWLVVGTLLFRPPFEWETVLRLWDAFPELTVFALCADGLPLVLGVSWLHRWALGRLETASAYVVATRWAALLAIGGLLIPLHASNAAGAAEELAYRAATFVALTCMLDGRLTTESTEAVNSGGDR